MKRIAAGLLTMVMLLSWMMPVFAEEEKGSITITNTVAGQTYTVYRMFDLESYNSEGNFSYKVCNEWNDFFVNGEGKNYIKLDEGGYIADASKAEEDPQAFSKVALAWTEGKEMEFSVSEPATGDTLSFENLPLGYYLVDSTLGTLCNLTTTVKESTINDKNKEAALFFAVMNKEGDFDTTHDADINSLLNYRIKVRAKAGAENYQIYVNKPSGIVENRESIKVTMEPELTSYNQEQTYPKELTNGTHYTVFEPKSSYSSEGQDSEFTFGIKINQEVLDQINTNVLITITYEADLTSGAACSTTVKANPNTSTAWMSYGTSSMTDKDITKVYTYHLPIFKYTGDLEKPTALSGAEFCLYRKLDANTNEYASFNKDGEFVGWVSDELDTTEGASIYMTSNDEGKINLCGLATGDYYLEETAAPAGYNKLLDSIPVQISMAQDQVAAYAQDNAPTAQINVLNNTGSKLPSTGGMGTKIFYALGATMFVSAVILLVVRKRMSK